MENFFDLIDEGNIDEIRKLVGEDSTILEKSKNVELVSVLVSLGADINTTFLETGENGLHFAARKNSVDIANLFLTNGINIEATTKSLNTAYHIAAQNGSNDIIDFLDKNNANINAVNAEGQTPLHLAVICSQKGSVVKLLQKSADIVQDKKEKTPFDYAKELKENDEVRILINDYQEELSFNELINNEEDFANKLMMSRRKAGEYQYLLWNDVIFYGREKVFNLLIESHIDVNAKCPEDQKTPLHYAAEVGKVHYVKALLDRGAKIDAVDIDGNTPLHIAVLNVKYSVIKELVQRDAAIQLNKAGDNLIEICARAVDSEDKRISFKFLVDNVAFKVCIEKMDNADSLIEFLDNYPIIVEVVGQNLIFSAITFQNQPVVEYLIKHNINVNCKASSGYTPLHQAVFDDRPSIVEFLLKEGADINAAANEGETALHIAVENGYLDIVKILASNEARILPNAKGETPADIASKKNDPLSKEMKEAMGKIILLENRDNCVKAMTTKEKFLLQLKQYPDVVKVFGTTLAIIGVKKSKAFVIDALVSEGVSINEADENGQLPLHVAIQMKDSEMIGYLLKKGANPHIGGIKGRTAILVAASVGAPSIIKMILIENVEYAYDEDGKSSHDLVLESDSPEKEEALRIVDTCALNIAFKKIKDTRKFIDFISKNKFLLKEEGLSYLEYSILKKNSELTKYLLDNGITPNMRMKDGSTLLHKAVKEGRNDFARVLIANGAFVGLSDANKATPLHYAAMGSSAYMVNLLITNGATKRKDSEGKTPLDYAASNASSCSADIIECLNDLAQYFADMSMVSNYHQFKEVFRIYKMKYAIHSCIRAILYSSRKHVEYIINHGLKVNSCDEKGFSLLHYAVPDHYDIAKFLISKGANLNCKTDGGFTPLHLACKYKCGEEILHLLIDSGADVNCRTSNGITPLFYAVKNRSFSTVSILLNNGADPNLRTDKDIMPLDVAVYKNENNIANLLIIKGADKIALTEDRKNEMASKVVAKN